MTTKRCSTCKKLLPIENFCKHPQTRDGLQSCCKACANHHSRKSQRKKLAQLKADEEEFKKHLAKMNANQKAWWARQRERDKSLVRRKQRSYRYKISQANLEQLEKRCGGACEICGKKDGVDNLVVDHCHTTGKVRGFLCKSCNTALGKFKDSPNILRAAIRYLA